MIWNIETHSANNMETELYGFGIIFRNTLWKSQGLLGNTLYMSIEEHPVCYVSAHEEVSSRNSLTSVAPFHLSTPVSTSVISIYTINYNNDGVNVW